MFKMLDIMHVAGCNTPNILMLKEDFFAPFLNCVKTVNFTLT